MAHSCSAYPQVRHQLGHLCMGACCMLVHELKVKKARTSPLGANGLGEAGGKQRMGSGCAKRCGDADRPSYQHRNKNGGLSRGGNEVFRESFKERVILSWAL